MTRKDFVIIANILKLTEVKDKDGIDALLKATNPNYNSDRFWRAVEQ